MARQHTKTLLTVCAIILLATTIASRVVYRNDSVFGNNDAAVVQQPPQPQNLIDEAIRAFETIRTLESTVRLKARFYENEYMGAGNYFEKRSPPQSYDRQNVCAFLTELQFQSIAISNPGTKSSTLQIVCNGKTLWKNTNIEDSKRVQRIKVDQIMDMLANSEKRQLWSHVSALPYLGSIEGTLRELENTYDFPNAKTEIVLIEDNPEELWKITALLKKEVYEKMIPVGSGKHNSGTNIPSGIAVYLDTKSYFPKRIDYYGETHGEIDWSIPLLEQEYRNIEINVNDIPNSYFDYVPSADVMIDEATESYAKKIGIST